MLTDTLAGAEVRVDGAFEDVADARAAVDAYLAQYPAESYGTALSITGIEGAMFVRGVRRLRAGPTWDDWCPAPLARDCEQRELQALRC